METVTQTTENVLNERENSMKNKIKYSEIFNYLKHRNKYFLESGLLWVQCEFNDKSGADFNREGDCMFQLTEDQNIYYVEKTNKYDCKIKHLIIEKNGEKLKIHL